MKFDLFNDFLGQQSWGRICSAVALVVAVIQEFRNVELTHVALWLSIATGTYTVSKITQMINSKTTTIASDNNAQQ